MVFMDCSVEYIEMCRKAVDVQKLRSYKGVINWQDGDFFTESGNVCSHCVECNEITQCDIWLPRQDQLQDMVEEESRYRLLDRFNSFFHCLYRGFKCTDSCFTSMEQLWLAFVMHKLYQKKWDGSAWVKE